MGIEFFLISYDLPNRDGTLRPTFLPIWDLVLRAPHRRFRTLPYPSIGPSDTIASIVNRMCLELRGRRQDRYPLDVLRIYAHGDNSEQGDHLLNGEPVHILLGEGLTPTTAMGFRGMSHLWHTTSAEGIVLGSYTSNRELMRALRLRVTPRIEVHTCYATIRAQPTLQALASAARAPVFAADAAQATDDRAEYEMTNWDLEGRITSFYP
jgi:hypothetical protein